MSLVNDYKPRIDPGKPICKGTDARDLHRLRPVELVPSGDEGVPDTEGRERTVDLIDQLLPVNIDEHFSTAFNRVHCHVREEDGLASTAWGDVQRRLAAGSVLLAKPIGVALLVVAKND